MALKKNTFITGLLVVLAIACSVEGYVIYRQKADLPDPVTNRDIGALSKQLEKQFKSNQANNFQMFDRFFDNDFFSGTHYPFDEMKRLHKQMNTMMNNDLKDPFNESWNAWFGDRFLGSSADTDMHMTEKDKAYVVTLSIPHLKENHLKVNVDKDGISVNGDYSQMAEKKDDKDHVISKQEIHSSISRSMSLPPDADYDHARIDNNTGSIVITVPKRPA